MRPFNQAFGSYGSGISAGVLAGGVVLGGPLDSLVPPWVVSPGWPGFAPVGVGVFPELGAPGACSPSGAPRLEASGCPEEADWADDVGVRGGWALGGNSRLLSKDRTDSWGAAGRTENLYVGHMFMECM